MYGLIGNPLGHSFSADFFNTKFKNEGIDEIYELFPIPSILELPALLEKYPDLKGLNVTIPYKEQILSHLTCISDEAANIGAVNVVKIVRSQNYCSLKGYNTDAIGFHDSIKYLIKPHMQKALILGTGGASNAVDFVLHKMGIDVRKVSRHPKEGQLSYSDLTPDIIADHYLIINATPIGMWPNTEEAPDIPYSFLTHYHLCFDLIYNPEETEFMKRAAKYGATVKNGLEMLHLQANAAWEIWRRR